MQIQPDANNRHLHLLADCIPHIVWIVDATGQAIYFNRQWVLYTGVAIDSTTPSHVAGEFVHPEDHEATMSAWNAAYARGGEFRVEHRIRSKLGEYRWFLVLAELTCNADGEPECWFGTSTDIHDKKLSELALMASESRFRALVNATSDVVYRMSPDWKHMYHLDRQGYPKTTVELSEYRIEEYIHPDDLTLTRTVLSEAIGGKHIFELEHRVYALMGAQGGPFPRQFRFLTRAARLLSGLEWQAISLCASILKRHFPQRAPGWKPRWRQVKLGLGSGICSVMN